MQYRSRILALCCPFFAAAAAAQTPPSYGFHFVTVTDAGNAAYAGPPLYGELPVGRGRVDYEYRMARTETSTAHWMHFLNTFSQTSNPPPHFDPFANVHWGAEADPTYAGPGIRYRLRGLPSAGAFPVTGISFNMAMLYCNWLHNGQSLAPASLRTGAYDMALVPAGTAPSQHLYPTHEPGARFWIPTLDEWLKASQYDPDRFGPGVGGWWQYRNSSDEPGTPGPPGVGTTSAGWEDPAGNAGEWRIPLGAYPGSVSPWGLLDTSGGAAEWTEEISGADPTSERFAMFPAAGAGALQYSEWIGAAYSAHATGLDALTGLRLAAAVPTTPTLMLATPALWHVSRRRRRI